MLRKVLPLFAFLALLVPATSHAQSNQEIKAALDRVMPEIKFTNVALRDCFDFLRDVSAANIHVNWKAIEATGVTPETTVNVRLRAISLRKIMGLLLSESGANGQLTFYTDQGVIEVTTKELADKQMITKVYNVEDLLVEVPDFEPSANLGLTGSNSNSSSSGSSNGVHGGSGTARSTSSTGVGQTGIGGGVGGGIGGIGGGGGAIGGGGGGGSGGDSGKSKAQRGDELLKLIIDTIQPDVWKQNGGPAAIRFWNGNLIVTAPRSIHEQIGGPVD